MAGGQGKLAGMGNGIAYIRKKSCCCYAVAVKPRQPLHNCTSHQPFVMPLWLSVVSYWQCLLAAVMEELMGGSGIAASGAD